MNSTEVNLLTVKEVAAELGTSSRTVHRMIAAGVLIAAVNRPGTKRRHWRVDAKTVEKIKQSRNSAISAISANEADFC